MVFFITIWYREEFCCRATIESYFIFKSATILMFATLCCCHLFMLTCRSVTKHFPVLQPAHNYLTTVPKYIEKRVVLFVRSDFTLNFWKIKLPGSLNQDISTIYYWITIVQCSSILCGLIKKKLLISAKPYRLFGTTLFGIWNLSYPNSSSRNWISKTKTFAVSNIQTPTPQQTDTDDNIVYKIRVRIYLATWRRVMPLLLLQSLIERKKDPSSSVRESMFKYWRLQMFLF